MEEKGVLDNTVIVAFTDHYLYTIEDQSVLDKYKNTSNNLINNTPFFIWSSDTKKTNIKKVTSQLNILPTVLNLFGINIIIIDIIVWTERRYGIIRHASSSGQTCPFCSFLISIIAVSLPSG